MKEIQFLHKNIKKWEEFEHLLQKSKEFDPDRLYSLYITLTDDLAYANTFFPGGEASVYLNELTRKVHGIIYQNKPIDKKRIPAFWATEFPLLFYSIRKEFLIALIIFVVSVLAGILSTVYDPGFTRIILGDKYVNLTMENIGKNDPMAVYKNMNEVNMFLGITLNNIKVSFFAFISGILTAFGTGFILFRNGVMLGTFQTFLAQHGVIMDAFATVWLHGTIEIFSIITAGAAGIAIGNSFIFPGTYSRGYALKREARKGAKIILGLVPFFVVAGFIEGFVTRHTEIHYALRFAFIACSLAGIIYYFFIYPKLLTQKLSKYGPQ